MKHKGDLQNMRSLKTKEILEIIFKKGKANHNMRNIYSAKKTIKLVNLKYRIATHILKTTVNRQAQDRACIFCKERNRTIYHLFLECLKLQDIREDLSNYVEATRGNRQGLDWN